MNKQVKLQEVAEILAALNMNAEEVKNVLPDLIPKEKLLVNVVYGIDGRQQKFLSESEFFCPNMRLEAIKLDTCYVAATNYWQVEVEEFIRRKVKEYANSPQWQLPDATMLQELKEHYYDVNFILQKMKLHPLHQGLYLCKDPDGYRVFDILSGKFYPYKEASRFDVCRRLFYR